MLLLQQSMGVSQRLKSFDLARPRGLHRRRHGHAPSQHGVAGFLPPARQHKRMDLEGVGDRLHLNALQLTQLDGLELKLQAVPLNLPWACSWRETPPLVRRKCLLYRGKFRDGSSALLAGSRMSSHQTKRPRVRCHCE